MDYRHPAECLELLKRLPPVDIDGTQRALADMLAGLLDSEPAANQHLEVLERARLQVELAQTQLARRYASHPLPPDSVENQTLARVVGLWRTMARSYARISEADAPDGSLGDQRALLAQRRIDCAGKALTEFFRARRAPPAGAWAELHASYASAEARGVAGVRVPDPLNEVWKAQSPVEAYVSALLVDLANPFGRSEREFDWVYRWAQRFAPYCSLSAEAAPELAKPAAYGIDLAADHGLRPLGLLTRPGASVLRFDASRLAGQIRAVLGQFKQGASPSSLGLGADCPVDASARLLLSLYRPWGLASAGRRFPRRGSHGGAELCADPLAIAFHVAGKPFEPPTVYATQRSVRNDISLLTFGEMASPAGERWSERERREAAARLGFVCRRWEMADHSVGGFRLRHGPKVERLEHRQLVGIRPPDGERFLLGMVSWLMYHDDGVMEAGIHILPGLPQVASGRPLALHAGGGYAEPKPVFLLPATPALKTPASLVVPAGWYQPQRVLDLDAGRAGQVRLSELMLRGTNFDQVSFEPLESAARAAPSETAR